jgi:benzoylformate decarboxylase
VKAHEVFAKTLKGLGIFGVFGNPGTTEMPMLQSIDRYFLTLHDSIAVSMADGYSLYELSPSVVNLHAMPGVGNSMAFIHTARTNRSPVIVTSGQQDTRHIVHEPLLYGDLVSLVSHSVKYAYEIKNPNDIQIALKKAMEIALTPPMGPVFVSLPMDYMDSDIENHSLSYEKKNYNLLDIESVKTIAERFESANDPAIVFGYEIDAFGAHEVAESVARNAGCPVYIEPLSHRASFNSDSDQYAGTLSPASTMMNMQLSRHDLVLFVGGGALLYPYSPTPLLVGKESIFVGFDVNRGIGESYCMSPKSFLREFAKLLKRNRGFRRTRDLSLPGRIARARTNMGVDYVLSEVHKKFSGYTIVDESVSYSPKVREILGYSRKNYFFSRSGALGWALGAAMGISIQNRKVLAILGEGASMYTIQGLWTMKRYGLPVKVLVLNNGGYNILKSYAMSYHPKLEGADFLTLDLKPEEITKGFGVETELADKNLAKLDWLREGDSPKVLVVNVDKTVERLFL